MDLRPTLPHDNRPVARRFSSQSPLSVTTGLGTVSFGILIEAGHVAEALDAVLLLMSNIICVDKAGVITFLVRGIRALTWPKADRARRVTRVTMALWAGDSSQCRSV